MARSGAWGRACGCCVLALALASPVRAEEGAGMLTLLQAMREAAARYPGVEAVRSQRASAVAELERARAARWPVVSIGAGALQSGQSSRLTATATPQATYKVYAGGGIEAGIDRARWLVEAADSRIGATLHEVSLQAGEAYLLWARALAQLQLARQNLQVLDQIRADMAGIVEVDKGRSVDLNLARVRVQSANLTVAQREVELEQARLRVGRFVASPLPREPAGLDDWGPAPPGTLEQAQTRADDWHPVIAQALAQVEAARSGVTIARAQLRVNVDLSVARQLSPIFPNGETVSQLSLNMPVFNGGAGQAAVRGATEQWRAAQSALDEQRLVLRERIGTAWTEWHSAGQRVDLSVEQVRTGEQLVENYRAQFRMARRSLLELLNVQNEVFGYQSAAVQARFDVRVAALRLTSAMGRLAQIVHKGGEAGESR